MSECNFIDDGYNQDAYLNRVPRLYAAARFKFRPMLHAERTAFQVKLGRVPDEQISEVMAVAISNYVKEWDLKDGAGNTVPLKVESIRKIQPALFERIYAVLIGRDGGDPDPNQPATPDETKVSLQSILEGLPVGEAREIHDVKN